jgi:hypothetical protein
LLKQNLYGTPMGPRVFTSGARAYHVENGFTPHMIDDRCFRRDFLLNEEPMTVVLGMYMDEFFGHANVMESALWYKSFLESKWKITWQWTWAPMLGCDINDTEPGRVAFGAKKYVRELKDKYLQGESKPQRKTASRESITKLVGHLC